MSQTGYIQAFGERDIDDFLVLAAAEHWISDYSELSFLLNAFPQGCFSARDEAGAASGFVTSLVHDRSGWIGNLIIRPDCRGKGIGEMLFNRAVQALRDARVETLWLTASESGRPLYEKSGFSSIDCIGRWRGTGVGAEDAGECIGGAQEIDRSIDVSGWGDRRDRLLAMVMRQGKTLAVDGGFVITQPCGECRQLGPFAARDATVAGSLLVAALNTIPDRSGVVIDMPDGNQAGAALLAQHGFQRFGGTVLMYSGVRPGYHPEYVYGLASMGSMG